MSDKQLFKVVVRDVTFKIYEVEAHDDEEADQLVTDGEVEMTRIGDGGEWEVVSVTPVTKCGGCGEYIDKKHDGYGHNNQGYWCIACWWKLHGV